MDAPHPPPQNPFSHINHSPPPQPNTKIFYALYGSSSPCPLDGISVIVFKRCPYLQHTWPASFLHAGQRNIFQNYGGVLLSSSFTKKVTHRTHKISGRLHSNLS